MADFVNGKFEDDVADFVNSSRVKPIALSQPIITPVTADADDLNAMRDL